LKNGFEENHPRTQALRGELAVLKQRMKEYVDGMRRALVLDTQMADSRVMILTKEAELAPTAEQLQETPHSNSASSTHKLQSIIIDSAF